MSIKAKLISTCVLIAVGILVLLATLTLTFERVKVNGPIYEQIIQGKDLIADILPPPEYIIEAHLVVLQALTDKDPARVPAYAERFKKLRSDYDERHEYWDKVLPAGKIRDLMLEQSYKPAVLFFDTAVADFFPALARGNRLQAEHVVHDTLSPAYAAHRKVIDEIVTLSTIENSQTETRAAEMLKSSKVITSVFSLLIVAVIIVVFIFIIKNITSQLRKAVSLANRIADGDLTADVQSTSKDEIGQLLNAMKGMTEKLRTIISHVSDASSEVASATCQLHASAEKIATSAEEVASQTGTVATAGEEMSATSYDIASNCLTAAEDAKHASQSAGNGARIIEKTVEVMHEIASNVQESAKTVENLGQRSDQIGAIIGTIEDIADQTNLLALNAAIEAARAGEQGRGFAVVADEVRALAERTTRATREISEMIKSIQTETKSAVMAMELGVQQVNTGTVEAARSGEALNDILEQVNAMAAVISQIATAAEQQTATTREISQNIHQINEVMQETVNGALESATAATQLTGNAEGLERLVHQFRI
ncbi:MAG: methyl-accepting chemotaxis protein [Geobacteraceae bacterium]|nr:methyl-accepting chemotaxis protein [Geobacteraceae bacterium]